MEKRKTAPDKKVRNIYRGGVTGALILLAAFLAVVMLNLLASALPRSATKLDLTAEGVYSLSGETKERLAALEEDVTLTLMAPAGEEDTVILSILEQYAAASPRVRLEEKDPALYPHFAEQYTDEAVGSNSVLVTGEKRAKYLSYEDLYRTDVDEELYYATGSEGVSTVFVGESRITSALAYVTGEKLPKIRILTGHGEAALPASFAEALSRENYETEELNLLSLPSVPEDADLILINDPERDLTEPEYEAVAEYLARGGGLLLTTDFETGELPRLFALAASYGLEAKTGLVVEGDSGHAIYAYPYYLLPDLGEGETAAGVKEAKLPVVAPMAGGILVSDELPASIAVEELLKTSARSYLKAAVTDGDSVERAAGDESGPFLVGASSVKNGGEESESGFVWFSSASMTDEAVDGLSSGGNVRLILSAIAGMAGTEEPLPIAEKSVNYSHLTIPEKDVRIAAVVLIGVLPAGILLLGGAILWRRRRRK